MNIPENFKIRMKELLGNEFDQFMESYNNPRHQGLRINTLKTDIEEFIEKCPFKINGIIPWEKRGLYIDEERPGKHPYHAAGLYYIQEPSAMAVVPQLEVKRGERVLDLCAAPGGKSTQAAALLEQEGLLVSNEIEPKRARILSENIERMGIKNAVVTNNSPSELVKYFKGFFDKIIVDAPCSGEGMFKKEETAIEDWSVENVIGCSIRQNDILESADHMIKPGGHLVYSTCTFSLEENELVIKRFLDEHENYEILDIDKSNGFSQGFGNYVNDPRLKEAARLFPHRLKGEGHFIALLHKIDGETDEKKPVKAEIKREEIKDYLSFMKEYMNFEITDNLFKWGDELYSLPHGLNDVKGLRILRSGLHLGTLKKNRFEPSHALALSMKPQDAKNHINLQGDGEEVVSYLRGNTINSNTDDGWCLITVDGFSIGWGKVSKGVVKNHYPKGLRW